MDFNFVLHIQICQPLLLSKICKKTSYLVKKTDDSILVESLAYSIVTKAII